MCSLRTTKRQVLALRVVEVLNVDLPVPPVAADLHGFPYRTLISGTRNSAIGAASRILPVQPLRQLDHVAMRALVPLSPIDFNEHALRCLDGIGGDGT